MQNQFRFSLFGSTIELRSNSNLVYMEQIFRHLEHKVLAIQEALGLNDALKTAIITAFLLVDELLTERAEYAELLAEDMEAAKLIDGLLRELQELHQLDK